MTRLREFGEKNERLQTELDEAREQLRREQRRSAEPECRMLRPGNLLVVVVWGFKFSFLTGLESRGVTFSWG